MIGFILSSAKHLYQRPLTIVALGIVTFLAAGAFRTSEKISFNDEIRPILNKHCISCHGGVKQSSGLNLIYKDSAFVELQSGKRAIVPKHANRSELISRIQSNDKDYRMPPEGEALSKGDIAKLTKWINQGAKWQKHWAYKPPENTTPPEINSDWIKSDIDKFILDRLKTTGLQPNAEAQKETLIRRASLDLIGLPPSEEEISTFLNDQSSQAFDNLIDRLLKSPHYGEKWAGMWLDLARYADSKGYEKDNHREIWKYRDWVINAFNDDMPYDQFTIEQMAGDLLPHPTTDQLIATGFHRNTMNNSEGGAQNEEFRIAAVMDRVNTSWEVWNGTTFACVQCHGHPYDPFTHEEYYEYMSYFNNTRDEDIGDDSPNLKFFNTVDEETIKGIQNWVENLGINQDDKASISAELDHMIHVTEPKVWSYKAEVIQKTAKVGDDYILQGRDGGVAVFRDFPFHGITHFLMRFNSSAADSRVHLTLDSLNGKEIAVWELGKPGWKLDIFEVDPVEGVRDLYLTFRSKSAKWRENDGVGNIFWILPNHALSVFDSEEGSSNKAEFIRLMNSAEAKTPILYENPESFKRDTRVFDRGSWMTPTEEVSTGIPHIMPEIESQNPQNRLELVKWLMSPENPLTARVMVNRLWEQLFGNGIVLTLEDFGSMGEPPTHPELLDYLAHRFQYYHNWSIKGFLKEIMSSATYRQSSKFSEQQLIADPYNRLLSRGPRFRLSAEQIRDQTLAVSGLLSTKMYGPSVMPFLPEGGWNVVYPQYTRVHWKVSEGEDKYRRALYTYWKRTSPYPSMVTFDVQNRDVCASRRIRTNTPLQALITLNDPIFVEASNHLGKLMEERGDDLAEKITYAYRRALAKKPDNETLDLLVELYEETSQNMSVTNNAKSVNYEKMELNSPSAVVANAILNLDAYVMKD